MPGAEPYMLRTLALILAAAALLTGNALAQQKKTCCEKAQEARKECTNKCCIKAHKEGKSCTRCNPNKEDLKNLKPKAGQPEKSKK